MQSNASARANLTFQRLRSARVPSTMNLALLGRLCEYFDHGTGPKPRNACNFEENTAQLERICHSIWKHKIILSRGAVSFNQTPNIQLQMLEVKMRVLNDNE